MGDSAGVGYKIGSKIVGVRTHIKQQDGDVAFLVCLHSFEGFKKQIDEHLGGFTTLLSSRDFVNGRADTTEFFQGIDYTERGDPRSPISEHSIDTVEYFYAAGDDGKVYYYQDGKLTHTFDIDEHVEVEFVFRSEK